MAAKSDRGYFGILYNLLEQIPLLPLLLQWPQSPLPGQMIIDANHGFPRVEGLSQ